MSDLREALEPEADSCPGFPINFQLQVTLISVTAAVFDKQIERSIAWELLFGVHL